MPTRRSRGRLSWGAVFDTLGRGRALYRTLIGAVTVATLLGAPTARAEKIRAAQYPIAPESLKSCYAILNRNYNILTQLAGQENRCFNSTPARDMGWIHEPCSGLDWNSPKCAQIDTQQCRLSNWNNRAFSACANAANEAQAQRERQKQEQEKRQELAQQQQEARYQHQEALYHAALQQHDQMVSNMQREYQAKREAALQNLENSGKAILIPLKQQAASGLEAATMDSIKQELLSELPPSLKHLAGVGSGVAQAHSALGSIGALINAKTWAASVQAIGGVGKQLNGLNPSPVSSVMTNLAIDVITSVDGSLMNRLQQEMALFDASTQTQQVEASAAAYQSHMTHQFAAQAQNLLPSYSASPAAEIASSILRVLAATETWRQREVASRGSAYSNYEQQLAVASERQREVQQQANNQPSTQAPTTAPATTDATDQRCWRNYKTLRRYITSTNTDSEALAMYQSSVRELHLMHCPRSYDADLSANYQTALVEIRGRQQEQQNQRNEAAQWGSFINSLGQEAGAVRNMRSNPSTPNTPAVGNSNGSPIRLACPQPTVSSDGIRKCGNPLRIGQP